MTCAQAVRFYFQEKGLRCPEDFSLVTIQRDETEERFLPRCSCRITSTACSSTKLMLEVIGNSELEYRDIMMSYSMEMRRVGGAGPA